MDSFSLKIRNYILFIGWMALLWGCQPTMINQSSTQFTNIELGDQIDADSSISAIIKPYKEKLDAQMNDVIGKAAITLDNKPGRGESLLGNFVADLMLTRAEEKYGKNIDMAIINAHGGLRSIISKGDIEVKDIFELMPFENTMMIIELDGKLTRQFFDRCAKTKRNNVAGARFIIRNDKANNILIDNKAFDNKKTYTLAISDYLANGGGGFHFLKDAKFVKDLNYKVRDMIIDHVKIIAAEGQEINASWDQRIKIIN